MRLTSFVLALAFLLLPALNCFTGTGRLFAAEKSVAAEPAAQVSSQEADRAELITASTESPEDLITSTEMMIEKLILQMDRESSIKTRGNDRSIIASLPSIRPIQGYITSDFGLRLHPVYKRPIFHTGTDFSAPVGTRVLATADGVVASSGFDKGYGKKVVIDHGFGYQTIYAHLSKAVVRQGQHIRRGDVIAFSGNTGLSTGPHLHYEVRKDNIVVNPTAYFQDDQTPDKFTLHDTEQAQDNSHS
ncbi:MAG: M23 family metallopeptidase [Chlorobiaceae bacterium]|nr:M23 family metallopeptidase [Chlorobiaceae bacterium]NTV25068.1 M23 family metallopeptidase [Chlorobiaceae bacterium]